jgi:hypothetical protein
MPGRDENQIRSKTKRLISQTRAKVVQKEHRAKAQMRGTPGRPNKKGKATKTNKPTGGKLAR